MLAAAAILGWSPELRHAVWQHARPAPASQTSVDVPQSGPMPTSQPRKPAPRTGGCASHASLACYDDDVWWFDGCGDLQVLADSCGGRGCNAGRCEAALPNDDACAGLDEYGRCEGDVAKACLAGRVMSFDCRAKHARCVMTSEGAQCLARDDKHACAPEAPATCHDNHLRLCVDGRFTELDCSARKAVCSVGQDGARCVALSATPRPELRVEVCDGHDNNLDGRVDEGGVCDVAPLVAFVPAGAALDDLDARMQNELAILNRVLDPLRFRWGKIVEVDASYRRFDPKDLEAMAAVLSQAQSNATLARTAVADQHTPAIAPAGFDFYIPVLFTERLLMDPPKSGISTLPNARCGRARLSDQPSPAGGVIVLTELRRPETLAHEMGHYLGLCHTHEQVERFAVRDANMPACARSGDGICDTPLDPGASLCPRVEPCEPVCTSVAARPDASNVMSYYMGCRRAMTAEQSAETQRNMSLRRGWFPCLDPRACPCQPAGDAVCPAEMSCHPGDHQGAPWSCELDGAGWPGASCRDSSQCSQGAFCLWQGAAPAAAASCTRPCRPGDACTCIDVGLPFRVCSEDLLPH